MGLLENEWIKVGVNKDRGTFGSGHLTSPGILFDPTGSGNFDTTYDYLSHINDTNNINTTSNIPHDGFALKVDGANKTNNNQTNVFCSILGGVYCTNDITGSTSFVDDTNKLTWTGTVDVDGGTWSVKNTYSLLAGQKFINIQTSITAGSNASTVYFAKYTDPDPSGVPSDAFNTNNNKLGHSGIASTQLAFAQATVSGYAIGLYSAKSNVTAGIQDNTTWTSNPATQADAFNEVWEAYRDERRHGEAPMWSVEDATAFVLKSKEAHADREVACVAILPGEPHRIVTFSVPIAFLTNPGE